MITERILVLLEFKGDTGNWVTTGETCGGLVTGLERLGLERLSS